MNMENNPTIGQLRDLIRGCDDRAGHHVLWVARNGDVYLSTLSDDQSPASFQENQADMQLRFETFQAGNEYVGPDAAEDDEWIEQLYEALVADWPKAKEQPVVEYIDQF